jgi:hypothetical protein
MFNIHNTLFECNLRMIISKEDRIAVKKYVVDTILSVNDDTIAVDELIQIFFPKEWNEAQDEILITIGTT